MITEFKMSEVYGKYMLNILVKTDSTDAEVSLVGEDVGEGVFDIREGGEEIIATFKLSKKTDKPEIVRDAFKKWLNKDGAAILDSAITGEPMLVVEEPKPTPKPSPKTRAKAKPKPKAE